MPRKRNPILSKVSLKKTSLLFLLVIGIGTGLQIPKSFKDDSSDAIASNKLIEVFFSPRGGCTKHVIEAIEQAKEKIHLFMFSFFSDEIAEKLVEAKARGVKIYIIADNRQAANKYSKINFLGGKVDETYIDNRQGNAHNKFMIIDCESVLTGSFNYSKSAEKYNRENLLHIHDEAIAKMYYQEWQKNAKHPKVEIYGELM